MASSLFQQQQNAARLARQTGAVQKGGGFRTSSSVSTGSQPAPQGQVFNSKSATFGPGGNISFTGGGSGSTQFLGGAGQIVNQPGAIVGAPGFSSFDAFGNPLTRDRAVSTRPDIIGGVQRTPVFRNSSGQLVSATPSPGSSSGPLLALGGSSASLGLPPSVVQFSPISIQQAGQGQFPQTQPLQPAPASGSGTEVGQVLQQASGKPLTPQEFERLRQATGATDDTFDLFFERVGKDIFARSAGLTGQAPLSPSEFSSLRKNLGVGSDNFGEFFNRQGDNIFFKRSNLAQSPGAVFNTAETGGGVVNSFDSSILSSPEAQLPDFSEDSIADPVAWIRSLSDIWNTTKTDFQVQLEQQQQVLFNRFQDQVDRVDEIDATRRQMEDDFQIQEQVKQINELNLTIQQKNAEFEQGMFNIGQQATAAPFIAGQQQAFQQQAALEIGALVGTQQAMMGNFDLATNVIDRSIEQSFKGLELQIGLTRDFLAINQDQMSQEEKKQSFVIDNILNERERVIEEQKQEKMAVKDLMLDLAQIGGDPRKMDFNKSFAENAQVYSEQRAIFDQQERSHAIQQARALAGNKLITDNNGRPVGTFNELTGDIKRIGGENYVGSIGPVTAYGSYDAEGNEVWRHGLDIDVTKGQQLFSPVAGVVTDVVYSNEGFGNQVKIVDDLGNELWFSHLDAASVAVGQEIKAGQALGAGGNSGFVIPGPGGDGSHLDLTIVRGDGNFMTPHEVEAYVNDGARRSVPAFQDTTPDPFEGVDFGEEALGGITPEQSAEDAAKQAKSLDNAVNAIDVANRLETHPGLGAAVGLKGLTGGIIPFIDDEPIPGTDAADFVAELNRLKAILSADRIEILRGLGAMSERELAVVTDSATSLNRDMSEKAFKSELGRIRDVMADVQARLSDGQPAQPQSSESGDSLDAFLNSL